MCDPPSHQIVPGRRQRPPHSWRCYLARPQLPVHTARGGQAAMTHPPIPRRPQHEIGGDGVMEVLDLLVALHTRTRQNRGGIEIWQG